ncbi:pyocin knob domain-containing protein [Pseudomonas entomophila]|uniref:Pyocin knob domain-containing protein n=2 Tax=Pseudomonas entomophila TaxID=312306 RepID=A0ABY9QV48_9PSED|nr:pyocin knob domain-containing protein [Pseudomonas entomophila]WMW07413.1 pyocin knob domain-containing protein [Pseudomonas entomophila]CAK16855.1 putative phage protein [Pseudomonas entomophila L48]
MALDPVRLGTPPSGLDGDDARTAFSRINANFAVLDNTGLTGLLPATRNVADCNDASGPGWWSALSGSAAHLPPGITYPLIHTSVSAGGFVTQFAIEVVSGKSATRAYNVNTKSWTVWTVHADAAKLGTAATASLTTSSADATLGRVLKVGDFGVGGHTPLVASSTLNTLRSTGDYYVNVDQAGVVPGNVNGHLSVRSFNDLYSVQEYTPAAEPLKYLRVLTNNAWSAWNQITTAKDLASSPFDSAAGKLLKVGDHGIGTNAPTPTDLNALVGMGGIYRFNNDTLNRPPSIAYGAVLHLGRTGGIEAIQVAYSVTGYEAAVRFLVGSTWRAWANTTPSWLGQSWQNMTAARAAGVNYTNDTGRPIQVSALFGPASVINTTAILYISGVPIYGQYAGVAGAYINTATCVIPPGAAYSVAAANGTANLAYFYELR